ncbi:hypothetical protein C3463_02450 [Serratia marcescens]|jgi:hypothetical protein|nr:hypothetical protein C3463_02450 [Serratia marcescens]RJK67228.1 hypothetical protein CMV60_08525 [Serratia marcescens]
MQEGGVFRHAALLHYLIIGVRMALTLEAGQREISTFDSRMIGACVIGGRGKKAPAKMRGKTHNNTREIGSTHFADTIRILWVNFTKILCSECDKGAVVHK